MSMGDGKTETVVSRQIITFANQFKNILESFYKNNISCNGRLHCDVLEHTKYILYIYKY